MSLASEIRPTSLDTYIGQYHLVNPENGLITNFLRLGYLPLMLLMGPPGVGKTTLAKILASTCGYKFMEFSATDATLRELRDLTLSIKKENMRRTQSRFSIVVFIDEFHRFSKTQQDYLLPFVEDGSFVFIGATTEPRRIRGAIFSRCQVFYLRPHTNDDVRKVVQRAIDHIEKKRTDTERDITETDTEDTETTYMKRMGVADTPNQSCEFDSTCMDLIVEAVHGDTRRAINIVELLSTSDSITPQSVNECILMLKLEKTGLQDKRNIPLFHNFLSSLWTRGVPDDDMFVDAFKLTKFDDEEVEHLQVSDDEAGFGEFEPPDDGIVSPSIFWLLRLLECGESPTYIAKRLVIFACLHLCDTLVKFILSQVKVMNQTDKPMEVLYQCVQWISQQEKHVLTIPDQLEELKAYFEDRVPPPVSIDIDIDFTPENVAKVFEWDSPEQDAGLDFEIVYDLPPELAAI